MDGLAVMGDGDVEVCGCPGALVPGDQGIAQAGQVHAVVGMAGAGGVYGLLRGVDGCVEVCGCPRPPEPDPQRDPKVEQVLGAVGVAGGGGVDGLAVMGDGGVEV